MKYLTRIALTLFIVTNSAHILAQKTFKQPKELGKVTWLRDYDKAISLAKKEQKDILILFQEVPGCSTCRNYGHNVLSNPLMVEAIENSFIPLAIYNNKGGKDKVVLDRFNEPSWNNPVVRIINTKGKNVVSRISGDYSAKTLQKRMVEALQSYGKEIPDYLKLLGQELSASGKTKEKYFKMYCFWTGEKQLAKVDGVLSTQSGFMNGEVVKVSYDASKVDEADLDAYAKANSFRPVDASKTYKPASNDIHYYLRHTDYKYIPLTELQQTKINSAIGSGKTGDEYLSPKQYAWFVKVIQGKIKKDKNLLNIPFNDAWSYMEAKLPESIASK
jgi:hypothetical protein